MRIIQLTDFHLNIEAEKCYRGISAELLLKEVIKEIVKNFGDFDYFVITGDLAHDESIITYERLRDILQPLLPRCLMIPGNHDNREGIRSVFSDIVRPNTSYINFALPYSGRLLIGIDSHITDTVYGKIGKRQLTWLDRTLSENKHVPTLLFIHHPPVPVGSPWLDEIGLKDACGLQEIIARYPQVKAIFTGHIHHEFEGKMANCNVYGTPATCIQFLPKATDGKRDTSPPGFRTIIFNEGTVTTHVHFLSHWVFKEESL